MAIKHMATGDVRLVEATKEKEPQLQASTSFQGPTVALGSADLQNAEAPRLDAEAPGSGAKISKRRIKFKIISLKLMLMMMTNPYTNLPTCQLIQECIKEKEALEDILWLLVILKEIMIGNELIIHTHKDS